VIQRLAKTLDAGSQLESVKDLTQFVDCAASEVERILFVHYSTPLSLIGSACGRE